MKQGVLLADRYELRALLGTGGMGRVFLGRDRVLERDVAVKILAPHLAEDERAVARFRAEARAAAGLSHPTVVSVFDSGSQGDVHYLVMELVEGSTLSALIGERGTVSPREAASIAERVATGLAVAHAAGIVHRDVKPGNVMVTSDGDVKIMDFGIARAVSSDTATHTAAILGTVSYLSPEQARGDSAEPRSDLYALGVVLHEMLTGTPPFVADSPLAVAFKHLEEEPAPPSSVNPDVPPELDAVVGRAMAKDPDARHPTAEALAEDLRAFLGEERVAALSAAPVGPGDAAEDTGELLDSVEGPTPRWHRHVLVGTLAVILAALVPLALGLAAWVGDTEPAPATTRDDTGGSKKQKKNGQAMDLPTPTPNGAGSSVAPATSPKPERETTEKDGTDGSSDEDQGDEEEEEEEEAEPSPSPSESASPSPSPTASPSP